MTLGRLLYFGLVSVLALVVLSFFALFASTSQAPAAMAIGWMVMILSLQVSKAVRR